MKRWLIYIVIALLIVLIACSLALPGMIARTLKAEAKQLEGIDIRDISYQFWTNTLQLDSIHIDETALPGLSGTIEQITVDGIDRWKYFRTKHIDIGDILLDGGSLVLNQNELQVPRRADTSALHWHINMVMARRINLSVRDEKLEVASLRNIQGRASNLSDTSSRLNLLDHFLMVEAIDMPLAGDPHRLSSGAATYDPQHRRLIIENLQYATPVSEESWYGTIKKKASRYNITVPRITIHDPDLAAFRTKDEFKAPRITLTRPAITVFEDQRFTHCTSCIKPLLQKQFAESPHKVNIDSIQIVKGQITYRVREKNRNKISDLIFSDFYASAYHINNMSSAKNMLIDTRCTVFEQTPLQVHFNIPVFDPRSAYTYRGTIGAFDLPKLNDFSSTLEKVSINHGTSQGITFAIQANDVDARGNIDFAYKGLTVKLLNDRKWSSTLLTDLINHVAIRRDNISGPKFKKGIVYDTRDRSRSIFHSLSKSLQSGIRNTVVLEHVHLFKHKRQE